MRWSRVSVLGVLLFGAGLGIAVSGADAQTFSPVAESSLAEAVGSQPAHYDLPSDDGRTRLDARAACSESTPGLLDVSLSWEAEDSPAAWRVDVTEFGNGFGAGRFLTTDRLSSAVRSVDFASADPGIYYYWRLLARSGEDWVMRANGRFEAPVCPVDLVGGES